jgi:hypothetical protein
VSNALQVRSCADITPSAIQWLWQPYLARGKFAILDGDHASGKSLVVADLAARLSRGEPLPNGQRPDGPVTTLLLSEDPGADTVRPRLSAAGADLTRVLVAELGTEGPPQLPDCAPELKRLIQQSGARLLVLDPLAAFVPRTRATRDSHMKRALAPLVAAAAETGCAVLAVRCPDRNVGPNAVYRGAGSAGALGVALTGMLLAPHPAAPGLSVLALTKAHLGSRPLALGFEIRAEDDTTVLNWTGVANLQANELCIPRTRELVHGPNARAAEFLRRILSTGPRPVAQLQELAANAGFVWRTVERAKRTMKILSERLPRMGWLWRLPDDDPDNRSLEQNAGPSQVVCLIRQGVVLPEPIPYVPPQGLTRKPSGPGNRATPNEPTGGLLAQRAAQGNGET